MGSRHLLSLVLLQLSLLIFCPVSARAIDAVADASVNPRWHCSEKTDTATFLAGDKPETAKLILNKPNVLGQTVTVTSDASYLVLSCAGSPKVVFQIPANPDGTASKFVLTGGDQPTLSFNGKEQIQQQGKWIQIETAKDATISLELGTASFASVKFEPPAPARAEAAPIQVVAKKTAPTAAELLRPINASQLSVVCKAFDQGINKKCPSCGGAGEVSVQVQTGSHNVGPYSVPNYENRKQKCTRCNGSGIDRSKDEVLIRLAGNMVKGLAAVKQDDPKTQQTLTDAYGEITKDMIGDQRAWITLTQNGKSILAQKAPALGTTVVSMVKVKRADKLPNNQRRFLVQVMGIDKEVYVDDPTLADQLNSGHALMGGMVDQSVDENGNKINVLHGGFLIAPKVDKEWWWWYKYEE
jgi:hypothetical protein